MLLMEFVGVAPEKQPEESSDAALSSDNNGGQDESVPDLVILFLL